LLEWEASRAINGGVGTRGEAVGVDLGSYAALCVSGRIRLAPWDYVRGDGQRRSRVRGAETKRCGWHRLRRPRNDRARMRRDENSGISPWYRGPWLSRGAQQHYPSDGGQRGNGEWRRLTERTAAALPDLRLSTGERRRPVDSGPDDQRQPGEEQGANNRTIASRPAMTGDGGRDCTTNVPTAAPRVSRIIDKEGTACSPDAIGRLGPRVGRRCARVSRSPNLAVGTEDAFRRFGFWLRRYANEVRCGGKASCLGGPEPPVLSARLRRKFEVVGTSKRDHASRRAIERLTQPAERLPEVLAVSRPHDVMSGVYHRSGHDSRSRVPLGPKVRAESFTHLAAR
jgi:hypothetical protein